MQLSNRVGSVITIVQVYNVFQQNKKVEKMSLFLSATEHLLTLIRI